MIEDVRSIEKMLKPVTWEDYEVIDSYLKKYPAENCDFNICTLFTWGLYFKLEYAIFENRLILFNPYYQYLLSPVGEKLTALELFQLNNCCKKIHKDVEIMVISEDYIANTPNIDEYFTLKNDEDWNDYIYSTESLVNLSGKKLAKKKNLISQFMRLYPQHELKPVTNSDYEELMNFCYYWKDTHKDNDDYLDIEFEAIKTILLNWDKLPCEGYKLYANDKLCAFSVYSKQTDEMATVHYEKYDIQIKGAGQVINHETAKVLLDNYKYINREQDMGIEGIRQAKRSYQPIRKVPFYRLKSK